MKEAEYAVDKSDVVHRAISLPVFIAFIVYESLDGPGYVTSRMLVGFLMALMMIWFPAVIAEQTFGGDTAKYIRFFGWVCLVGRSPGALHDALASVVKPQRGIRSFD